MDGKGQVIDDDAADGDAADEDNDDDYHEYDDDGDDDYDDNGEEDDDADDDGDEDNDVYTLSQRSALGLWLSAWKRLPWCSMMPGTLWYMRATICV